MFGVSELIYFYALFVERGYCHLMEHKFWTHCTSSFYNNYFEHFFFILIWKKYHAWDMCHYYNWGSTYYICTVNSFPSSDVCSHPLVNLTMLWLTELVKFIKWCAKHYWVIVYKYFYTDNVMINCICHYVLFLTLYFALQLTSILGEIGLNIQEAHAFSTSDGFSLDVFVVEGWPNEVGLK